MQKWPMGNINKDKAPTQPTDNTAKRAQFLYFMCLLSPTVYCQYGRKNTPVPGEPYYLLLLTITYVKLDGTYDCPYSDSCET